MTCSHMSGVLLTLNNNIYIEMTLSKFYINIYIMMLSFTRYIKHPIPFLFVD